MVGNALPRLLPQLAHGRGNGERGFGLSRWAGPKGTRPERGLKTGSRGYQHEKRQDEKQLEKAVGCSSLAPCPVCWRMTIGNGTWEMDESGAAHQPTPLESWDLCMLTCLHTGDMCMYILRPPATGLTLFETAVQACSPLLCKRLSNFPYHRSKVPSPRLLIKRHQSRHHAAKVTRYATCGLDVDNLLLFCRVSKQADMLQKTRVPR